MAGPERPPIYPLMWAPDPTTDFLRRPDEMRALIEGVGFWARAWGEVAIGPAKPGVTPPRPGAGHG